MRFSRKIMVFLPVTLFAVLFFALPSIAFSAEGVLGLSVHRDFLLPLPQQSGADSNCRVSMEFSLKSKANDSQNGNTNVRIPQSLEKTLTLAFDKALTTLEKDLSDLAKKNRNIDKLPEELEKKLVPLGDNCKKISTDTVKKWLLDNKTDLQFEEINSAEIVSNAVVWLSGNEDQGLVIGTTDHTETDNGITVWKRMSFSPDFLKKGQKIEWNIGFKFALSVPMPASLKEEVKAEFVIKLEEISNQIAGVMEEYEKLSNEKFLALGDLLESLKPTVTSIGDECQKISDTLYNKWLKENKKDPALKEVSTSKKTVKAYLGDNFITRIVPTQPGAKANSGLAKNKKAQIESSFNTVIFRSLFLATNYDGEDMPFREVAPKFPLRKENEN